MTTTWIIQQTRNPTLTIQRIVRGCAEHKKPVKFISVTPFSTALPEIDAEPPFVLYGYSTLILNAYSDPRLRGGVFFDPDLFRPSIYQAHWGSVLLNDYRFDTVEGLQGHWSAHQTERFFVKPDNDLKQFTGCVMSYDDFQRAIKGIPLDSEDTLAFCPPDSTISTEFRVVMVGGHAVAASSYRPDSDVLVPDDVIIFAEKVSRLWWPAPVYVLDISRSDSVSPKGLRIVEANCFNGSSFYNADVSEVVRQVSRYQELHHDEKIE